MDSKRTEYIAEAARAIVKEGLHLHLIGCNGIADVESLVELKNAGIASYNHNLETSQNFFPNIAPRIALRSDSKQMKMPELQGLDYAVVESLEWGRVGRIEWTFSMLCKR